MTQTMNQSIAEGMELLADAELRRGADADLARVQRLYRSAETLRWCDTEGDDEDKAADRFRDAFGVLGRAITAAETSHVMREAQVDKVADRDPGDNVEALCERAAALLAAGEKGTRAELRDMVRHLADVLAAIHEWRSGLEQCLTAEREAFGLFIEQLSETVYGELSA